MVRTKSPSQSEEEIVCLTNSFAPLAKMETSSIAAASRPSTPGTSKQPPSPAKNRPKEIKRQTDKEKIRADRSRSPRTKITAPSS